MQFLSNALSNAISRERAQHRLHNPTIRALFVVGFAVNAGALRVGAGETVLVGREVATAERLAMQEIDHSRWEQLLAKHVDRNGMVNYRAWKADAAAVSGLDNYLNHLSRATWDVKTPAATQIAFWINAYNAVTVRGILREYPTSSIRNHTARLLGYNIWKDLKLRVAGRQFSLDDMEHKILRKMGEPRIHFAIVCASIGCPKLQAWAFTPDKLDSQLTTAAQEFFQDKSKVQFDLSTSEVRLSQILSWFGTDFGKDQKAQLRYIALYAPAGTRELLASGRARVSFLEYDWGLNEQK